MLLAIVGNIVTSWSWFDTNMLGVGLNSYRFINKVFMWLPVFWLSQTALIAAGLLATGPRKKTAARGFI
jgi:hypothetical protein